jgi:DNA-binding MarR family transcriptional regulator
LKDKELSEQLSSIEQLLLRVSWLEQRRFAQDIAALNLTPPQFFVLRSIRSRGANLNMSSLADDTAQHCATVTGIVARLEKMGLVTRHRDTRDRRQVLVELTPLGSELLSKIRGSRDQRLRETLQRLSVQDANELLRLLRAYLEALRRQCEDTQNTLPTSAGGI